VGDVLFQDNFESYAESSLFPEGQWTDPGWGDTCWYVITDTLNPAQSKVSALIGYWGAAAAGDSTWTDYRFSAMVRSAGNYAAIMARFQSGHGYALAIDMTRGQLRLTRGAGGFGLDSVNFTPTHTDYYKLSMDVTGDSIKCYVDSVLQFGVRDTVYKAGKIGLYGAAARYDDVLVTRL
jgi:hypothetical protein